MANHPADPRSTTPSPVANFFWKDLFKRGGASRSVLDVLKDNILFKTLDKRDLGYLSNFVYERVYQEQEAVFEQGERGIGMYIIVKGRVAIKTQGPQGEHLVTTLGEGSFFGEIALVEENSVRSATAVPLEKSIIVGFFKPDLREILERKPDVGVKILFQLCTVLARRLVETTDRISQTKQRPNAEAVPRSLPHEDDQQAV